MDTTTELPMDWNQWRAMWEEWRGGFESRWAVRRGVTGNPFPGKNMLADEILGTWTLGEPGTDGTRLRPVELSEATFMGRRIIGVTVDGVGTAGQGTTVSTFAELDDVLARIVAGDPLP